MGAAIRVNDPRIPKHRPNPTYASLPSITYSGKSSYVEANKGLMNEIAKILKDAGSISSREGLQKLLQTAEAIKRDRPDLAQMVDDAVSLQGVRDRSKAAREGKGGGEGKKSEKFQKTPGITANARPITRLDAYGDAGTAADAARAYRDRWGDRNLPRARPEQRGLEEARLPRSRPATAVDTGSRSYTPFTPNTPTSYTPYQRDAPGAGFGQGPLGGAGSAYQRYMAAKEAGQPYRGPDYVPTGSRPAQTSYTPFTPNVPPTPNRQPDYIPTGSRTASNVLPGYGGAVDVGSPRRVTTTPFVPGGPYPAMPVPEARLPRSRPDQPNVSPSAYGGPGGYTAPAGLSGLSGLSAGGGGGGGGEPNFTWRGNTGQGVDPGFADIISRTADAARDMGIRLEVTGKEGGHRSHHSGWDADVRGFYQDGTPMSRADEVKIAAIARENGANRFGFYKDSPLHVGVGGKVEGISPDVVWNNQMTGQPGVDTFFPEQRDFVNAVRSGKPYKNYTTPTTTGATTTATPPAIGAGLSAPAIGATPGSSSLGGGAQQSFFDAISRAEGTTKYGYNTVYGGGYKDLSQMTIKDAFDWGAQNLDSNDLGMFQLNGPTAIEAAGQLGMDPTKTFMTPDTQNKLALHVAGTGPGLNRWVGLNKHPDQMQIAQTAWNTLKGAPAAATPNVSRYDPEVATLQKQLNSQGADLTVDGIMGPLTRAAMNQAPNQAVATAPPSITGGTGGIMGMIRQGAGAVQGAANQVAAANQQYGGMLRLAPLASAFMGRSGYASPVDAGRSSMGAVSTGGMGGPGMGFGGISSGLGFGGGRGYGGAGIGQGTGGAINPNR